MKNFTITKQTLLRLGRTDKVILSGFAEKCARKFILSNLSCVQLWLSAAAVGLIGGQRRRRLSSSGSNAVGITVALSARPNAEEVEYYDPGLEVEVDVEGVEVDDNRLGHALRLNVVVAVNLDRQT